MLCCAKYPRRPLQADPPFKTPIGTLVQFCQRTLAIDLDNPRSIGSSVPCRGRFFLPFPSLPLFFLFVLKKCSPERLDQLCALLRPSKFVYIYIFFYAACCLSILSGVFLPACFFLVVQKSAGRANRGTSPDQLPLQPSASCHCRRPNWLGPVLYYCYRSVVWGLMC